MSVVLTEVGSGPTVVLLVGVPSVSVVEAVAVPVRPSLSVPVGLSLSLDGADAFVGSVVKVGMVGMPDAAVAVSRPPSSLQADTNTDADRTTE
ncbi:hypothetical protein [Nannocystis pusilla]|uniref:hypothetical protein n=1 Tax=Nannocystis pusilla TaxID=889268 RepID=UPI001CCFFBD9|nr:hypothetical protein [Nannocystis pusilla]